MLALTLLCSLCLPGQALPGQAFATTTAPLVLHAGPSAAQPGVLELEPGEVLRTGDTRGLFVQVFLPRGFPVYLHGDYAESDPTEQLVHPSAKRVNLRLLPSTAGLVPVGQVGEDGPGLVWLGSERLWLRCLAPVDVPLYASADALEPVSAERGQAAWERGLAVREERRQAALRVARVGRPGYMHDLRAGVQADLLARQDLTGLQDADLEQTLAELEQLRAGVGDEEILAKLGQLAARVREVRLERQQRAAAQAAERSRLAAAAASLEREARTLATGLRFAGKGDAVTITGRVSRKLTPDGALSVFSIADGSGRLFKLSAARDLADLSSLADHTVTLKGRSLKLVNVGGTVLIVDRVTDVRP